MTLFATVAADDPLFEQVLTKFFGGHADARTLELLGGQVLLVARFSRPPRPRAAA